MHGLLCSARAAANRITRIVQKRVRMKMSAQNSSAQRYFGGNSIVRKDTVCHVRIITSKIRLRQKIKLEFIIHFIHKYVCMRRQIDAAETQAEPSLPLRP